MNWIQNLYFTYNNCAAHIGYSDEVGQRPLLPICHITQQAHIEIVIDGEGNFLRAQIVPRDAEYDSDTTIIPCTEESAGRSGIRPEPHPLCDKLQFVAGDFIQFGGSVTSGFKKDPDTPFRKYLNALTDWCYSPWSHPKAIAVLKYVKKRQLIHDLVSSGIIYIDAAGKFMEKDEIKREKNAADIFSVIKKQDEAFVRWKVEIPNEPESRVWKDRSLWESWISYYLSGKKETGLCLVTGDQVVLTYNHPKYIRREGDRAKLISSNDDTGFTYRGRFILDRQACGVGLEVSQKAHNALAWLISKQGYQKDDLAIVAWAESGKPVPQPTDDPLTLLFGNTLPEEELAAYTAQEVAEPLKKRIAGYSKELGETDNVAVIALDSASKGRLAIIFYRRLKGSEFLQKIDSWHSTCAWLHRYRYRKDPKSGKAKPVPFFGAPAPSDIAEAAYGRRLDGRLRNATITRLLPCIVDGHPIPRDLVVSVIRRASNRAGLSNSEWEKVLSIACALYRKCTHGKETFEMTLDETRKTRDYLFGRLLAIADFLEERALLKAEQSRPTNAARYMQQFSQSPSRTWKQIHELLTPYIIRLGDKANYYKNLIAEVTSSFDPEDYISNKPLTGEYLLGYYCQRHSLHSGKVKSPSADVETSGDRAQ